MKEKLLTVTLPWLLKLLEKQGVPFLLLIVAIAFFYQKTESMESERQADKKVFQEKLDVCQAAIIDMYKEDRKQLIIVLEANTRALERVNCK